jgi:hypothetical protein
MIQYNQIHIVESAKSLIGSREKISTLLIDTQRIAHRGVALLGLVRHTREHNKMLFVRLDVDCLSLNRYIPVIALLGILGLYSGRSDSDVTHLMTDRHAAIAQLDNSGLYSGPSDSDVASLTTDHKITTSTFIPHSTATQMS